MDAIAFLENEHREVERLFGDFEQAGPKANVKRKRIVKKIVDQLSRHANLEEQLFYPVLQDQAREDELALKAMEEHDLIKPLLQQLEKMSPSEDRYGAKVSVLMQEVREHVRGEEREIFPKVRNALTQQQLEDLGQRLEQGRKAMMSPKDYLRL